LLVAQALKAIGWDGYSRRMNGLMRSRLLRATVVPL
jgi:hypothetical protein